MLVNKLESNIMPSTRSKAFFFALVHFLKGFVYHNHKYVQRHLFSCPRDKHFLRKSLWSHLCNMIEPTQLVTSYVQINRGQTSLSRSAVLMWCVCECRRFTQHIALRHLACKAPKRLNSFSVKHQPVFSTIEKDGKNETFVHWLFCAEAYIRWSKETVTQGTKYVTGGLMHDSMSAASLQYLVRTDPR